MSGHTKLCRKRFDECEAERREWASKWPAYCQACEGSGVTAYPGSRYEPPSSDLCQCQDTGRCPRCGEFGTTWDDETDDATQCTSCGWDLEHPDIMPGHWECWGICEDQKD